MAQDIICVLLMLLGVFDAGFWDVTVEYAKNSPCDLLCRYTVCNRSNNAASIHVLPTLWFRSASLLFCLQSACKNVKNVNNCDFIFILMNVIYMISGDSIINVIVKIVYKCVLMLV